MYFWHWARYKDPKRGQCAKRMHGLALQSRWNRFGLPPLLHGPPHNGLPAIEITHPFHFKMSPGVLLGPCCNHDLGVLLRLPTIAENSGNGERDPGSASTDAAISAMLEVMGDSEYYCATYSSKDQPHIDGLLMTLAHGLKGKERDIAEAREAGKTHMH